MNQHSFARRQPVYLTAPATVVETGWSGPVASKFVRNPRLLSFFGLPAATSGVKRCVIGLFAFSVMFVATAEPVRAEVTAIEVQRSIDRGVEFLRKTQLDSGGWNEFRNQSCGLSSLCTLAMLNAGVSREDPDLIRALNYLRRSQPTQTYSLSLQTLVFCQAGIAADIVRIRGNVVRLVNMQNLNGDQRSLGAWNYGRGVGPGDKSNSQFAILAIGAAVDRGILVDQKLFQRAMSYWSNGQLSNGGWGYRSPPATGSMTCAGIASMVIARGHIVPNVGDDQIDCCGDVTVDDDPVDRALEHLGDHFSVIGNPGGSGHYFYYLYALERVGRLTGRRFIGGHDWYREGAERLIGIQAFDGSWQGSGDDEGDRHVASSFALLFLGKGKRQVVVGRLETGRAERTAQVAFPNSLKQLVHFVERDWGRDLTWQAVVGDQARVEDLLQTPVLVISGRDRLKISETLADRLGEYLNQGGTVLFDSTAGDGCGNPAAFEQSVRELCERWFPASKLDRLPTDHPVWYAQHDVKPDAIGQDYWVYGLQACCRTAVFYSPKSLSCRWERGSMLLRRDRRATPVGRQVESAVRIGENVIAYATGRELKDKLDRRSIVGAGTVPEPGRGAVEFSVLELGAGEDQVPRAASNAAAIIRQLRPIQIRSSVDAVALTEKSLASLPLIWVHGRTEFEWTETQRTVLRAYLRRGGVVLASAICGNEAFNTAFRRELNLVLPDAPLQMMPSDHPALSDRFGGFSLNDVTIRQPTDTGRSVEIRRRRGAPVIEFAETDSLVRVLFSPLDLSCALESRNSIQCPGYSTDDAAKVIANLLLFVQNQ